MGTSKNTTLGGVPFVFGEEGYATSSARDYIQLLKPRVMALVIFTAFTALLLAPGALHPYLKFLALLSIAIGSGAAGALNMWWERRIDAQMKRTAMRPLPQGKMRAESALAFGMILSIGSVALLGMATNVVAAGWLAFTIFFYVVIYTMLLKPRTPQNIVLGGAAGALPPVVAWAAIEPGFTLLPWLLFSIIFLWTPAHFWALGLVKAADYKKAGIPILPNTHGEKTTRVQIFVYALLTVVASLLPSFFSLLGHVYLFCAVVLGVILLWGAWQLFCKKYSPMKFFGLTIFYLFALFLSMIIDHLVV